MSVRGIQFVVDESGGKTAVIVDLKRRRRLWEDMYDRLLAESRKNEPRVSLDQVNRALERKWARAHG